MGIHRRTNVSVELFVSRTSQGQLSTFASLEMNLTVTRPKPTTFLIWMLTHLRNSIKTRSWSKNLPRNDAFLASDTIIKQIPRLLGPGLNKAGKFPTMITHGDNMAEEKLAERQVAARQEYHGK